METPEVPNILGDTEDFEFAALSEAVNYRRAIISEFAPYISGRALEVGAGIGQTTEALLELERIVEVVAVEPDHRFQNQFAKRLPHVRLVRGTTHDLALNEHFNATIMVNVLEHIDNDVDELLRQRVLLRENQGSLCILVPARPELFSKLDAHFGHFRRYTRIELQQKIERAGFTLRKIHYFNVVGYFAWALRFRIMGSMSFDIDQVRMFDRRIFPWMHRFESSVCRPPFGQSLIAVASA